MMIDILNMI